MNYTAYIMVCPHCKQYIAGKLINKSAKCFTCGKQVMHKGRRLTYFEDHRAACDAAHEANHQKKLKTPNYGVISMEELLAKKTEKIDEYDE